MYEIADYDELYRPYDKSGGELKHPTFVKLPAKPTGEGLRELLRYKRGLEVFGVWALILEKTTTEKKPQNRGKLLNHRGEPATLSEIARGISLGKKEKLVEYALSALVEMGWLENNSPTEDASAQLPPKSRVEKSRVEKSRVEKEKERFLDFVQLTKNEHAKLLELYGEVQVGSLIEDLNNFLGSKGRVYKSHYFALRAWARRNGIKVVRPPKPKEVSEPEKPATEEQKAQARAWLEKRNILKSVPGPRMTKRQCEEKRIKDIAQLRGKP